HFANARVAAGSALAVSMDNRAQHVLPAALGLQQTNVWAYTVGSAGPLYPGFTVEAIRGTPTTVTLTNNLSNNLYQLLTVDQTLHWADPLGSGIPVPPTAFYTGPVPTCVHLHGGEVMSASDGGPDSWFTPGLAQTGPAWAAGASNVLTYPNSQEAATLWFHDHALGVTRLNVYAGLAAFYLLRDSWDTGVAGTGANFPAGAYEIEIVIQDRMFDTAGQWFFPDLGLNPQHPYWVPEFVGDTIVVNGKTWPFLQVEPRRYRFRMLNGSNARFYNLQLPLAGKGKGRLLPFWQIGTDGGLLQQPVPMTQLLLAPGERADVIVDFAGLPFGTQLVMSNDARTPFPGGAPADPQTTGQIMQFRIATLTATDTSYNPATLASPRAGAAAFVPLTTGTGALATGVVPQVKRQLTLNEVIGAGGPLEVLVNNTKWGAAVTETPRAGSTELWQIINLTADAHPIHLHLVQFQLVSRQALNLNKYNKAYNAAFVAGFVGGSGPPLNYGSVNADLAVGGNPAITPSLKGAAAPPLPNEVGWKDTVIMYPGEVTTIVARWTPTDVIVGQTGTYPFDPTAGPGYVWHCHIIDHEDNEMMRPQKVV
ncbi:MAG: multicopper oxidase, partial [Burkholderiaceae bacterium]